MAIGNWDIYAVKKKIRFFVVFSVFLCGQVFSQKSDGIIPDYWKGAMYNGVCWAESNVDKPATFVGNPEEFGRFYQWKASTGWIATNFLTGDDTIISAKDPCPAGWRLPSVEEAKTLVLRSYLAWGDNLICFSDSKDNLWFPVVGYLSGNCTTPVPRYGYWSGSEDTNDAANAWMFSFVADRTILHKTLLAPRDYPFLIRCVADEKCDSIVSHDTVTICSTDLPYEWRDTTFGEGTKTGTYRISRRSCAYTDIAYLHLTIQQPFDTTFYDTVCRGASYNRYGFSLSDVQTDGDYTLSLSSQAGCDSVLTLHLKVHPVYGTTLYDTICQGNFYSNYGFSLPSGTSGGTFTKTYSTVHGCDSTVTLNLHVHPVYLFSETQHICQGDSISFRGRWLHTSGVYYDSLTTVHGCDSIYRLTLSVHSTSPLLFPDKVCYGSGYNKYGFSLPSVYHDTLVRDTFRSFWGCDSIRILSLSVQPVYDTPLYDTVCQGDGYYRHGFTLPSVQVDGVHTLTLSSRSGCDSTLILHLKVHPVYNTVLYDSICPSDYYERYGFRLSNLHESSTYLRTESTVHGCDSTVTLHLHVWPTYFYPETVHLCEGDTFDFRGMRYHESGEYYDSLTTTKGCDSIYCLYLSVHPVYDIQLCGVLCEGIPYTQGGFHVSTPGLHYQYLQSAFGCDSTVTLTLTEEKKIEGSIRVLLEDCSTHGYSFFFDPGDMINHWEWDLGDGTLLRSEECYHQYSDSGTYRIQLHAETYNECENRFSYVQRVPPYLREVLIHSDRQVIDEDYPTVHFRTEVFPGMRCLWDFGDGERGEGDRVSHTYNARTEKYYEVRLQVLNSDSCVTESRMDIEVVFLPKALNTFSPNGDGINDVFMPDYVIEIMDRNGLRIYSGASGWDGTYNGRQAKEDTYFYRLHYRTANGKRQKTGYVTLIR